MNSRHPLFIRAQDFSVYLIDHLGTSKQAIRMTNLATNGRYWSSRIINILADSSNAGVQVRLMFNELVHLAAWGRHRWKSILPNWKGRIAHALGMWICTSYRRIFSIQMCIHGMENIPPGAKILAANHPNISDSYLLPLLFDGKVRTLAQASQFRAPLLGWIFRNTGQIPVQADQRLAAYQLACEALVNGDTLLVYPEGRLNPDNQKVPISTGAVRMALKSGAPIIPIGIHVSQRDTLQVSSTSGYANSRKLWQTRGKFNVQIGKAWLVSNDPGLVKKPFEIHAMSECLMETIDGLRKQAIQESEK